jgi:hypothetical protein
MGAALLSSCSSSHGSPAAAASPAIPSTGSPTPVQPTAVQPTPDESAALKKAVNAYSVAYLSGDGNGAFALLSSRCKARLSETQMGALTAAAKATYGQLPIETYTVDDLSGDLARVTYTYSAPDINQTKEPWVRESGKWLEDDC